MTILQVIGSEVDVNARTVIDLGLASIDFSGSVAALFREPVTTYPGYGSPESPLILLRGQLYFTASGTLADYSTITEIDIGSLQQGQLMEVLGLSLTGAQLSALGDGNGHGDQAATNALLYGGGVTFQDLGQGTKFVAVGGQNTIVLHDPAQGAAIVGNGDGDTAVVQGLRLGSTIIGNATGNAYITTTNPATAIKTTASLSRFGAVQFVDGTTYYGLGTVGGQVDRLYGATLGRIGEAAGVGAWTSRIQGGESLHDVAQSFIGSTEFQQGYGSLDNADFVSLLYHNVLDRAGDRIGVNYWNNQLDGGGLDRASVVLGFSASPEFINDRSADLNTGLWAPDPVAVSLVGYYKTAFDRLPDAAGLASWIAQRHAGATEAAMAQSFYASPEFQGTYGRLSDASFVNLLYANTLGRAGDQFGVQTWEARLADGSYSRANVMQGFATSAELTNDLAPSYAGGIKTLG